MFARAVFSFPSAIDNCARNVAKFNPRSLMAAIVPNNSRSFLLRLGVLCGEDFSVMVQFEELHH